MKRRFIEDSYRKEPWFRALCSAFLTFKTEEEMANFLRDIATLSELQAFAERFEVAKQLSQGLSYRAIAKNTGASTTTVTRVAQFLENGTGGYRQVLHTHRHHRLLKNKNSTGLINKEALIKAKELNQNNVQKNERTDSVLQKYLNK